VFALRGAIPPRGKLVVAMADNSVPLDNDGDEIVLTEASGVVRSKATNAAPRRRQPSGLRSKRASEILRLPVHSKCSRQLARESTGFGERCR
jgi:hypothetical protein